MAWNPTYVQTDTGVVGGPGVPTYTKTFTGSVTAGNILVALCTMQGTAGNTVTDSQGNPWTKQREQVSGSKNLSLWTAFAGSAGACTVTLVVGGGGSGAHKVYEFTPDGATTLGLDTGNGANTTATATHAAGSVTPTGNDTWALFGIGIIGGYGVVSTPTGYTGRGVLGGDPQGLYEQKLATPLTHTPTLVTTTNETTGVQVVVLTRGAAAAAETVQSFVWMPV